MENKATSIENFINKAAEVLEVPIECFFIQSQKEEYCVARGLVWLACKNELGMNYSKIGRKFNRHRNTVRISVNSFKKEIEVSLDRRNTYKKIVNG